MKVYPHDVQATYPIYKSPPKPARGFFDFSCFTNTSCLESTEEADDERSPTKYGRTAASSYTTLESEDNIETDLVYLQTRKPQWNREINHWVHNFGGRVKIPSNRNFLVTQVSAVEFDNRLTFSRTGGGGEAATSASLESVADRVVIRHGKVTIDVKMTCVLRVAFNF